MVVALFGETLGFNVGVIRADVNTNVGRAPVRRLNSMIMGLDLEHGEGHCGSLQRAERCFLSWYFWHC